MVDHSNMKLGKLAKQNHSDTLRLAEYLTSSLPAPAPSKDWASKVTNWGMMANDSWGDCAWAGVGHGILLHTTYAGNPVALGDATIVGAYAAATGFNPNAGPPGNNPTDQGTVLTQALDYWKNTGVGGHKILGWAEVNPKNDDEVKTAIDLWGYLYLGAQLPLNAQTQAKWDVAPNAASDPNAEPGSWGGHCIICPYYDGPDERKFVTWGALKDLTREWFKTYVDEVYVVITEDWIDVKTQESPSGLNITQLTADLHELN